LIVSSQHVIPLFDFFCHRYNIPEIFGPISGFFLHAFKCFRQFSVLFVECAIVVLVKIKKKLLLVNAVDTLFKVFQVIEVKNSIANCGQTVQVQRY